MSLRDGVDEYRLSVVYLKKLADSSYIQELKVLPLTFLTGHYLLAESIQYYFSANRVWREFLHEPLG